jgi:hypothetical protein
MAIRVTLIFGAIALTASAAASAQGRSGVAFTATGTMCSDVTWSQEALATYPRIATACRDVLQRDGKYYVRFEGEVVRVADRGQQLTIDFRDGDRLTLTPPENLSLTINNRPTPVRELRPGDQLTFYVPQDQLAATFFAGQPETSPVQTVPITPTAREPVLAQTQPAPTRVLPRTASLLPMTGAAGLILALFGAVLTVRRRMR